DATNCTAPASRNRSMWDSAPMPVGIIASGTAPAPRAATTSPGLSPTIHAEATPRRCSARRTGAGSGLPGPSSLVTSAFTNGAQLVAKTPLGGRTRQRAARERTADRAQPSHDVRRCDRIARAQPCETERLAERSHDDGVRMLQRRGRQVVAAELRIRGVDEHE